MVVSLRAGRGVSHSHHGGGPIELYWVREGRAPIIHELTHVLAGYSAAHGHWTQLGFASYMQDRYGEDTAFPTHRMAHALVRIIGEERSVLPMLEVMRDRNRGKYFGLRTPRERWLAYTQSTSFCRYGKTATTLVDDWLKHVVSAPDDPKARALFQSLRESLGRR